MTLDDRTAAEAHRQADHVRETERQLAALAPYAAAVHAAAKHPAPGCSCFGCVGRDEAMEARAEARTEDRMPGREADRRADICYGDIK